MVWLEKKGREECKGKREGGREERRTNTNDFEGFQPSTKIKKCSGVHPVEG
jgi:hypothetical protein